MEVQTFDSLTLLGRRWWSRIVDTNNHEILYTSQSYKTTRQRDKTADRIAKAIGAPIVPGKRRV